MSKILLVLMLGASAFDVGTTEVALSRGLHEANPLMKNQAVRITVNIAVPIAIYKSIKGKPKKTQIAVAGSYIGLNAFVGIHNILEIKKHQRRKSSSNVERESISAERGLSDET